MRPIKSIRTPWTSAGLVEIEGEAGIVTSWNRRFFATWVLWLVCGILLWVFWLASVPVFLQRAAAGSLPTAVVNGFSPAFMAAENASAWGASVATWSWINVTVNGLAFLVFSLIAFLIWWRVRTGFGLLTAYIFLVVGSESMSMAIYGAQLSTIAIAAWEIGALIWPLFLLWLYLFPNGQAVPRRLLWVFGPLLALFASLFLLRTLAISLEDGSSFAQVIEQLQPIFDFVVLPLLFLASGAQIYRYIKVSSAAEREQTKWFLFGILVAFIPLSLLDLLMDYPVELDKLAFVALPVGIGISILRYRLWDIDVIIRKTLVYGLLTALLALVYFGSVVLLQVVFESITGQRSAIVIVISTLLIAALFAPLRRRVQTTIDRRFFRQKYNAQRVLAKFAQTARDEVELEALTAEVARVARETVQPESVSIWLREHKP